MQTYEGLMPQQTLQGTKDMEPNLHSQRRNCGSREDGYALKLICVIGE